MILGIKTPTGVEQIKNVRGWKKDGELVLIDCDLGRLIYEFKNMVLGVASGGFLMSRIKPFLKEGYKNIEE